MPILNLEQGGLIEFDLTSDGVTDTTEISLPNDLQIIRTSGTGNPILTFQVSNDGVSWADWWVDGFIFKDSSWMFEIEENKDVFFRISWLSNSSTGTFTANIKI